VLSKSLKQKKNRKNISQNIHSARVAGRFLKTPELPVRIDLERAKGSSEDEPFHR